MAAITAQILVGHTNQLGSGMIPTHSLFLSEGNKPVWILKNLDIMEDHSSSINTIRWVPTMENIFEDALLMISIHILRDKSLLEKAQKYINNLSNPLVELEKDIKSANLVELRGICRNLRYDYKLAISCFNETSLEEQLSPLEFYSMDVEICKSTYNRAYNPWVEKTVITGKI